MTRVLRAAEPELPQPAASLSGPTCAGARANGGWETCQVPVVICSHKNSARREREMAFAVVKVTPVCPMSCWPKVLHGLTRTAVAGLGQNSCVRT